MAYSLHTLALQAPTKSKKGGLLRRMLSPPRLEGIAAPSAARAANAASLVAACFCAALLAAGVGPPPFVELGILGGHLRLVYEVGTKLGLVFHLVSFFASLLVSGIAAQPTPNDRAAAQMLALALWAMLGGVWLAAAAGGAAAWAAMPRRAAVGVAAVVAGGFPLSLAAFVAVMSNPRR
jgi:hypothetical protein